MTLCRGFSNNDKERKKVDQRKVTLQHTDVIEGDIIEGFDCTIKMVITWI